MSGSDNASVHERWANFCFSVVGQLLAAPPPKGMLRRELKQLAARTWRHPVTGAPVRFGLSTIDRWYRRAKHERQDPLRALRRKVRKDLGSQGSMRLVIRQALLTQYASHSSWSVLLHYENLRALAEARAELRPIPSYSTIQRFFRAHGLRKRRRRGARETDGAERAEARFSQREVRSYEAEYVGGLFHWDCHVGSRKVLTARGEWVMPILFGVLDDRSRLACHLQWYLGAECAQNIVHGLSQAFMRRGLPRAAMSDNGAAMCAAEVTEGLARLGILHETTLPYSPEANGKIEVLWASVEGRLLAMLEGVADLTLEQLNEATQAWCEYEYNRKAHSETGQTPLARFLAGPTVMRDRPDVTTLRLAFTRTDSRTQRISDGTVVIDTRRFEVPNPFRHLHRLRVRYASWDLTQVYLVDERTEQVLCRLYPQDKQHNARGVRRPLQPVASRVADPAASDQVSLTPGTGMAPLLRQLVARQTATGLPPPYLPQDERPHDDSPQGEGDET
jgi:putative transposase